MKSSCASRAEISLLFRSVAALHPLDIDIQCDLYGVGDFVEGHVLRHAEVAAIEGEVAVDDALHGSGLVEGDVEGDLLGDSAKSEVALNLKSGGVAGGDHLGRDKGDCRILVDGEKVFSLDDAVFHTGSGGHAVGVDVEVEGDTVDGALFRNFQRAGPGFEDSVDIGERRADEELDLTLGGDEDVLNGRRGGWFCVAVLGGSRMSEREERAGDE